MSGFGDESLILRGPSGATNLGRHGSAANGSLVGGMGVVADTAHGGISAFSFDGVNDVLRGNLLGGIGFPRTMGGWFKVSSFVPAARMFVVAGGSDATSMSQTTNFLGVWAAGETTPQRRYAITNNWTMLVCVFNSESSRSVWINGEPGVSANGTSTLSQGNVPDNAYSIGARWNELFCPMLADDIRVLRRAMTADEIAAWYSAGRGYDDPNPISSSKKRQLTSYYHQLCS